MKKLFVALLAICIAFSSFSLAVFAEGAGSDTATSDVTEKKTVESLVGAYYLQGESGSVLNSNGTAIKSDYDYQIADIMAKALNGTKRVPFYAFNKDDSIYFESFAEAYVISEIKAAEEAGIDFFAYDLHIGYQPTVSGKKTIAKLMRNMNMQLIRHASLFGTNELGDKVNFAVVIDGDFSSSLVERELVIDQFLTRKGYLTAADGRPVLFIKWNDDIQNQITKINSTLKKAVADPTVLKDGVESVYAVALNAPSYDEAINAGAEAISWTEGTGKNGESYTNMTATVEANWANGSAVLPNVVTGFDKTLLADNPINIKANKKAGDDRTFSVRYSRTGTKEEYVAPATADELVNHVKNAVATTNKPENFPAVMVYAWDDFMGGAHICPTQTDKAFQYDATYLNALRAYFFGKEDGISTLTVLDTINQTVITDMRAKTITTMGKNEEGKVVEKSKVDFDGNPVVDQSPTGNNKLPWGLIGGIGGGAVVIIGVVIGIVVGKNKKKESE